MTSNPQIIADLRLIMEFDHDLELMNTYRGVPFICKAKALGIHEDGVEIQTHDPALVYLMKEKQTKVLGSDYFEPAVAHIASTNLMAGTALTAIKSSSPYRLSVRFLPNNPNWVIVFRYSIDRGAEITTELDEEYERALRAAAESSRGMKSDGYTRL